MKQTKTGLSITKKFFIFLFFLFIVIGTSSWLFLEKSKEAGAYDELNFKLHDIKFSMVKLEYTLDMFLVARHFEKEKIELIPEEVRKLDSVLRELESQAYTIFSANSPIAVGIKFLADDWRLIKNDFTRLNAALSYDVVLLLHNSIDMNMFLFYEKTEKLLNDVAQGRQAAFNDIKVLVYRIFALTLLLFICAGVVFIITAFYPIKDIAEGAIRVLNGEYNVTFKEGDSGEAGAIASAFNYLEKSANESELQIEKISEELSLEIDSGKKSVEALTELANVAGESLSQKEIYMSAINISILKTGAAAAAVYLLDDKGALRFKAANGIGGSFGDEVSVIPPGERLTVWIDGTSELVLKDIEEYPDGALKRALAARDYRSLLSYPIPYNKTVVGIMLLIFNESEGLSVNSGPFLKAVTSFVGASTGHINFFYEEHAKKNFLDSIVQQSPLGIAVFNPDGSAVMLNTTLKRMLGVRKDSDFIGKYKLFEDNILDSSGLFTMFRESFDGHVNEAVLDYDPSILTWYDFDGSLMSLKIKSFPIYDAGGEISGIALIYEDLAVFPESKIAQGEHSDN
jgi:PAS domain-containing protein